MEFDILPSEQIIGHIIKSNVAELSAISPTQTVSYSWGDQQELSQWIVAKDKEISGMRAFGDANTAKYPLIWLVTPIDGELRHNENLFRNTRFIICSNTKAEWLNATREVKTMPMLTDLANAFIRILGRNKNASIIRKEAVPAVKFTKVYNYPVARIRDGEEKVKASESLDNWDAISLTFDLKINTNCLKDLQLCQSTLK